MHTHFIHGNKRAVLLLSILLISACRSIPATDTEAPDQTPYTVRNKITSTIPSEVQVHNPNHSDLLIAHAWQLKQATDANGQRINALFFDEKRPLTVEFNQGRVRISNTCNAMAGTYTLGNENKSLNISPLIGTMMACPQPLMALDAAIAQRLEGSLQISVEGKTLHLQNANGDTLVFGE